MRCAFFGEKARDVFVSLVGWQSFFLRREALGDPVQTSVCCEHEFSAWIRATAISSTILCDVACRAGCRNDSRSQKRSNHSPRARSPRPVNALTIGDYRPWEE